MLADDDAPGFGQAGVAETSLIDMDTLSIEKDSTALSVWNVDKKNFGHTTCLHQSPDTHRTRNDRLIKARMASRLKPASPQGLQGDSVCLQHSTPS